MAHRPALRGYVGVVLLAGTAATMLAWVLAPPSSALVRDWRFLVLAVLVAVGQLRSIEPRGGDGRLELTFSVPFSLLLLLGFGPAVAIAVEAPAVAITQLRMHRPPLRVAFNTAITALSLGLAGLTHLRVAGTWTLSADAGPEGVLAAVVAGVVYLVVGNVAVSIAVGIATGRRPGRWLDATSTRAQMASATILSVLSALAARLVASEPWSLPALVVLALTAERFERVVIEQRHADTHDLTTGLRNRAGLLTWAAEQRPGEDGMTCVRVRLDDLDGLADRLGTDVVTQTVSELGERLEALADEGSAGRIADDVLVLLAPGIDRTLGRHAVERLTDPVTVGDVPLVLRAHVGEAYLGEDADRIELLLERAGRAVVEAVAHDLPVASPPPTQDSAEDPLALLAELRDGIARGELEVWYQPQVALPSGRPVGAEALVRWAHPRLGLLMPDRFVPVAERTILIGALTRAVLGRALDAAVSWRKLQPDLRVSVNASPRDLREEGFCDAVEAALAARGLPGDALEIEVTERAVADDTDRLAAGAGRLQSLGVRVALDDVGTGTSSMAQLRSLPIDAIKIDRTFLGGPSGSADVPIIAALVRMAEALGLDAIAEGVEDDDDRLLLAGLGCPYAQGYHFGRPLRPADALAYFAQAGREHVLSGLTPHPRR